MNRANMAKGLPPPPTEDSNNNENHAASSSGNNELSSHRNRLPLSLPLAIPLYAPPMEEVQQGGDILFRNFVAQEFEREHIDNPPEFDLEESGTSDMPNGVAQVYADGVSVRHRPVAHSSANQTAAQSTPEGYKNYDWTAHGRTLRDLADQFAQSIQGAELRQQAEDTHLNDITEERFLHLLEELFRQGFSRERLIALFYYCSLLLIRSRRTKNESLTRDLFVWSLGYIRDRVCQWVYEYGGWGAVFRSLYNVIVKLSIVALFGVAITCGVLYIRRNM